MTGFMMRLRGDVKRRAAALALVLALLPASRALGDVLELLSGARETGTLVSQSEQELVFTSVIGEHSFTRTYPVDRVHAITVGEQRTVLNAKGDGPRVLPRAPGGAAGNDQGSAAEAGGSVRTVAQVEALINELGRTPPDWFESTPLNHPQTLDLSWPEPAPGGWNNRRNMGQYIWDVINPNENRWREGVKLMHHVIQLNQNDVAVRTRAMQALGLMYYSLHQDYARAAFWWRAAGPGRDGYGSHGALLAHCYYKLGSKPMAMNALRTAPVGWNTIKVLGDIGEVDAAVALAERLARGRAAGEAHLMAGDVLRTAGRYGPAARHYEQAVALTRNDQDKRHYHRATAQLEAIRLYDGFDLATVPDGRYVDRSRGYEGDMEVAVTVAGGRITDVQITRHREKQFYGALTETTAQIIEKQSVQGIDTTARATITSEAIVNAAAKALAGASGQ